MRGFLLACVLGICFVQPAAAVEVTLILHGTITSATEYVGLFANIPVDLSGEIGTPATQSVSFDTADPNVSSTTITGLTANSFNSTLTVSYANNVADFSFYQITGSHDYGPSATFIQSQSISAFFVSPIPLIGTHRISGSGSYNYSYEDQEEIYNLQESFDSITVISSAVPEPSTWAMLLIGFAGIAFCSRRLRKPHRIVVV